MKKIIIVLTAVFLSPTISIAELTDASRFMISCAGYYSTKAATFSDHVLRAEAEQTASDLLDKASASSPPGEVIAKYEEMIELIRLDMERQGKAKSREELESLFGESCRNIETR
jgi:hypothetical protein